MQLNSDLPDVVERAVIRDELVGAIEFDRRALEFAVGVEREASFVVIACFANGGFGRRGGGGSRAVRGRRLPGAREAGAERDGQRKHTRRSERTLERATKHRSNPITLCRVGSTRVSVSSEHATYDGRLRNSRLPKWTRVHPCRL